MRLRILATSDLHMHLLPYDYLAGRPSDHMGLARTASLILEKRAEVPACLLLDNGDFLQGGPMGEVVARRSCTGHDHPAIAAMNALAYDAAALGNHDFNFGLTFLRRSVARARFPVLAANLSMRQGKGFAPHALLQRQLTDAEGRVHPLRIGVVGFLPPQTEEWDNDLRPVMRSTDIIDSARQVVPRLKALGADVIIALAHSGIGPAEARPRMEHAATALAALPGIDVVIAGHTHEVFPAPHWQGRPEVDPARGTLAGKPAVMPGFGGSHLGMIDLDFRIAPTGAPQIAGFRVACLPVAPGTPSSRLVTRPVEGAHRATLRQLGTRIGRSASPLSSHFAVIGHDDGLRLVNLAQRWHVRRRLEGTAFEHLPVLSATAPYRAGGRGGAHHYTHVAPGRLNLRHIADLYSFPNRVTAIRLSGAQLRDWLERSASMFNRVDPGARDVPLQNPDFPIYNFDVIDGVTWRIDLSQPARFHPDGRLADAGARRIRDLRWQSGPVGDDDAFILATNSYRLAGCGLFSPLVSENEVVLARDALTQDVLRRYIRQRRRISLPLRSSWRFLAQPESSVLFHTAPDASRRHLPEAYRLEPLGQTPDGFQLMRYFL
ncbi:bifunctional 2',3'-cyclic-nucleotide 2'-phosphodiesterase/3'-nucleotidase [Paracoccus sp. T5]|uniref:bifunctional 2',3'-cyclic-nucleotide 2'-phosphodiesterase/3'-nucleotidase n=1 Tax=Paracoccus sp. T5 TaxID=3402161 RepID=UPI003ADF5D83